MNPVQFYKCLADDTRLRCLMLIAHEGELCVCELTEALELSQPKVSRHLAQLRECELLVDRRQGKWVYYSLNPALPAWATSVLQESTDANQQFLTENLNSLCRMGDRPERTKACC